MGSQPHAAPQSVHGYGSYEKAPAAAVAPAALPVAKGYAPAPVYHAAPAPAYHAPVVKVAPVVHAAPVVKVAAPAYHAPAPAYKPAPYVEEKGAPEPYTYEYAVADDYSKAAFNAGETSDSNGVVSGSYTVALPDGRTQNVKYTADHYNGYVADVTYEGVPVYPEAKPYVAAPAPAYHA